MKSLKVALFGALVLMFARHVMAADAGPAWTADIAEIRRLATVMTGPRALRVNVVKVAESRRTKNFAVKGFPAAPSVQARTAYQLVFPAGTVMIDSGMDLATHRFFGRGTDEPYFPEEAAKLDQALLRADSILFTHEHGDHVAGVIRSPAFSALAPKTVLTRTQLQTLMRSPQIPELRVSAESAALFKLVDYDRYLAYAPGIVLISAPGHTGGSQIIYVLTQTGSEYLFAGDIAWHMDGVRTIKGKDAPWIKEPEELMGAELAWLNALSNNESSLHIVISHDEDQRTDYVARGILGGSLE